MHYAFKREPPCLRRHHSGRPSDTTTLPGERSTPTSRRPAPRGPSGRWRRRTGSVIGLQSIQVKRQVMLSVLQTLLQTLLHVAYFILCMCLTASESVVDLKLLSSACSAAIVVLYCELGFMLLGSVVWCSVV